MRGFYCCFINGVNGDMNRTHIMDCEGAKHDMCARQLVSL